MLTPTEQKMQVTPIYEKLENIVLTLDLNTEIVNAKQIFDFLKIRIGRKELYPILTEIISKILPQAKMVKF